MKVVAACVGAVGLVGSTLVAPAASAGWSRDCTDVALEPSANLRRCDLIGKDLTGRDLSGADLTRADLTNVFAGCDPDVPRTLFVDATLYRAELRRARLCDADLTDANLRRADLTRAQLEDADLDGTNLRRAKMRGVGVINASFRSANLRRADMRGVTGVDMAIWDDTTCPDGTNSDDHGGTCRGHLRR